MRLTLTPLAEQDLEAIGDHIAADNPTRALSFIRELRAQCQRMPPTRPATGCGRNWATTSAPAPTAAT